MHGDSESRNEISERSRRWRAAIAHGALALAVLAATGPHVEAYEEPALKDGSFVRPTASRIQIVEPAPGTRSRAPETISIYFQRFEQDLDPSSLELWIDGVEHTESLRFWVDRAWLDLPPTFWSPGPHTVQASVLDNRQTRFEQIVTFDLQGGGDTYSWPFDYDAPNVVANLMEDYQRFGSLQNPPPGPYWHHGLDIRAPANTPVRPVIGGYIAYKGCYSGCSSAQWNVTLLGDDDLLWQYSHLKQSTLINKGIGDRVETDEILGDIVFWNAVTNNANYHHTHINAVEWQGFDLAAWRALAEDPGETPVAVPAPLSGDFKWHNPLEFLTQAADLDNLLPEFSGEKDLAAPEILFLPNENDHAFLPANNVTTVSGDVDVVAHMMDSRDVIEPGLIPGQQPDPYTLGLYEVAYSIVPIDTECFKGWIPRTTLATFDTVPGEYDGDLQDELLLDVFQTTIDYGGPNYATTFEYHERNFWYNVTNSKWGILDGAAGYWNTDGATIQGPLFLNGVYRVTVYGVDFAENETSFSTEVTVDNIANQGGGFCPQYITHLALPDTEMEPPGGGSFSFTPPPIPIAFDEIVEGSSRTTISSEGWPVWYFDDPSQGLRIAIGVLDGNHVEVEYVPYLGDVILEIPAEAQMLPLSAGGPAAEFDPAAPSTRPIDLRLSTRLARMPGSGAALLGSPHGLDEVAFELVMAEPVDVQGQNWTLRSADGGAASWSLALPGAPAATPVPDGTLGAPLTAAKRDPLASQLDLAWDATTCTAGDYNLLFGSLHNVATLALDGSVCDLGTTGAATWAGVPPGDLWFLLVGDNDAGTESTWGTDSNGTNRQPTTPSDECNNTAKTNTETCP